MSPLTTHVLDTAQGTPAAGVPIVLEKEVDGAWVEAGRGETNDDGRLPGLLPEGGLESIRVGENSHGRTTAMASSRHHIATRSPTSWRSRSGR